MAYTGLLGCYHIYAYFGAKRSRDVIFDIKKCLQKILEIDPNLSDAYDGLAFTNAMFEWKRSEAGLNWQRSIELNSNNVSALRDYSVYLVSMGQPEIARKFAKRALVLDPLSDFTELCIAFTDFYTNKYEQVVQRLSKYLSRIHLSGGVYGSYGERFLL
ncbi:MAG: hypothetical protein MZV64_36560 [Ignavibacteriales bacterium]|nr:hypothetical protein [Ignavibacteriales bacterium]